MTGGAAQSPIRDPRRTFTALGLTPTRKGDAAAGWASRVGLTPSLSFNLAAWEKGQRPNSTRLALGSRGHRG